MSHAEIVNYEAIGLKCNAVCNQVKKELQLVTQLIEYLATSSTKLQTDKVIEMQTYLRSEHSQFESLVSEYLRRSNELVMAGIQRADSVYRIKHSSLEKDLALLTQRMAKFTTTQVPLLNQLINEELGSIAEKTTAKFQKQAAGIVTLSETIQSQLSSISDMSLREAVYRCAILPINENLPFEQLVQMGEVRLREMLAEAGLSHQEKIRKQIQQDMELARLDSKLILETLSCSSDIQQIKERAMNEIANEEVRLESVKIILKTIESRGFQVDRKSNIKIDRENNEVKILAQKANGQSAEFKVFLDGKFIYHFDGFEGQACQNDIQPFMKDLEEVYGFQITGRVDIWSNPDKLSSQKYQALNTNKGKK